MVNGFGSMEFRGTTACRLAWLRCLVFRLPKPTPSQNTPVACLGVWGEVAVGGHWSGPLPEKAGDPDPFVASSSKLWPLTLVNLIRVLSNNGADGFGAINVVFDPRVFQFAGKLKF